MSNEELGTEMTQKKSECGKAVFWVAVILMLVFLTRVILPCAGVRLALDLFIPDVGAGAEYFTEYDVSDDSLVMTDSHLNIGIPERYVRLGNEINGSHMYGEADRDRAAIIVMTRGGDLKYICCDQFNNDRITPKAEHYAPPTIFLSF